MQGIFNTPNSPYCQHLQRLHDASGKITPVGPPDIQRMSVDDAVKARPELFIKPSLSCLEYLSMIKNHGKPPHLSSGSGFIPPSVANSPQYFAKWKNYWSKVLKEIHQKRVADWARRQRLARNKELRGKSLAKFKATGYDPANPHDCSSWSLSTDIGGMNPKFVDMVGLTLWNTECSNKYYAKKAQERKDAAAAASFQQASTAAATAVPSHRSSVPNIPVEFWTKIMIGDGDCPVEVSGYFDTPSGKVKATEENRRRVAMCRKVKANDANFNAGGGMAGMLAGSNKTNEQRAAVREGEKKTKENALAAEVKRRQMLMLAAGGILVVGVAAVATR